MSADAQIGGHSGTNSPDVQAYDNANIGIMSDGTVQSVGSYMSLNQSALGSLVVAQALTPTYSPYQMQLYGQLIDERANLVGLPPGPQRDEIQSRIDRIELELSFSLGGGPVPTGSTADIGPSDAGLLGIDNFTRTTFGFTQTSVGAAAWAKFAARALPGFAVTQSYGARGVPNSSTFANNGPLLYPVNSYPSSPNQSALAADVTGAKGVFSYGAAAYDRYQTGTGVNTAFAGTGKIKRLLPYTYFGSGFSALINPATNLLACSMGSMIPYPVKWMADGLYTPQGMKLPISPGGTPAGNGTGATIKFGANGIMAFNTVIQPTFLASAIMSNFLCVLASDPSGAGIPAGYDYTNSTWTNLVVVNLMNPQSQTVSIYMPVLPSYSGANSGVGNKIVNQQDWSVSGGQGGGAEGTSW